MKRYRISLYTIFINLEDAEGRYLLIHGYTGAIDQASAKVISFLRSGKPIMESEELPFSKETLQRLIGLNGHLLGWKPCKLLNAIALGQIKAMNKKTAFTAGLK